MRALENSISSDGSVRRESREGRDYLVFPSVIAKEMVLDYPEFGRKEYLPAENLRQSAHAWAGAPITVDHPPDRGNGRTANTPEAYTSDVIGNIFNPEVIGRENDRIKAEAWVDIEKARSLGGEYENILNRLESGDEVGVSIGYGTIDDDPTPGEFDGESYELKQGTPVPDHLALVSSQNRPRATPEDGVGAPRLNHIDMDAEPETTDDMDIGMLRSGIRKLAEAAGIRLNQETGDAVRWESDAGGQREPDSYRYGVVVNGLNASDEPDDSVLVAVYRATSDYDGWENTGDQESIQTDRLEVIGNDGKGSLPSVSQVVSRSNTVNSDEESDANSDESEEAEADDSDEADAESTDSNNSDEADESDDSEDGDENTDNPDSDAENDLLDTMTDTDTELNRDDTIDRLDSDEDVPFDANVLEEMTDEQILTIDSGAADGDEAPDVEGGEEERDGNGEDADASAEDEEEDDTVPDDGEGEDEEENPDADAQTENETETPESPETPGDDSTETKVEMTVNELAERLNSIEEELEETKKENQELREKVDPDVLQAKQARELLADQADMDEGELASIPDETAINLAANFGDSQQVARANTYQQGQPQQQRPNMAGAPGPVSRTNTEEDEYTVGRDAYEQRKNGDS